MFQNRQGATTAAVLILAFGFTALADVTGGAAEGRLRSKATNGAAARGRTAAATAGADTVTPSKDVLEMGDDHEANIAALQKEKLELLRKREEGMRQAFAAGKVTQTQLDHASVDVLRAELEYQDRPHLRIDALEKLVVLLHKFEVAAELSFQQTSPTDASARISAFGRYVNAKLARIQSQINLEREKLELATTGEGTKGKERRKPKPE